MPPDLDTMHPNLLKEINPYPASIFLMKLLSAYHICYIYSNANQTTFNMKANTMNPDQTAP